MSVGEAQPSESTMLTRFRGEYAQAAIVNSAAELRGQVCRLQEGLDCLEAELDLPQEMVEYSGFGLIYFPEPTEEFAFTNPEVTRGLIEGLRAAGFDIPDDPGEMDNYVMRLGFCVDFMKKQEGYWRTSSLIRSAWLLAPVIREMGWGYGRDEFSQDPKMHVRHASAVRVPGIVLLEALLQHDPNLDEERVPSAIMADYVEALVDIGE